jgi:CubicO group peptidase (beta-lactamase class C family)
MVLGWFRHTGHMGHTGYMDHTGHTGGKRTVNRSDKFLKNPAYSVLIQFVDQNRFLFLLF